MKFFRQYLKSIWLNFVLRNGYGENLQKIYLVILFEGTK